MEVNLLPDPVGEGGADGGNVGEDMDQPGDAEEH